MALPRSYKPLPGGEHGLPKGHKKLQPTSGDEQVTVTLILRRRPGRTKMRDLKDFAIGPGAPPKPLTRAQFAAANGADPNEIKLVEAFGREHGLAVVESHQARRSVVLRGSVDAVNKAFQVELHDYRSPRGKYRGHEGTTRIPTTLSGIVEAVIGLTTRLVPAKHHAASPKDPANTKPLSPQQVASLYNFPGGTGRGQTIGIYEMQTANGPAGYKAQDLAKSMGAFGGMLTVPKPIDVAIDGVGNSGVSDGETGLDITVASAIAQGATIAVYFAGGEAQNIFHALQRMVHPGAGDPSPNVISISYSWGADDESAESFSDQEYTQLGALFQDAANLGITVLVSSGDHGTFLESKSKAQVSYPATDPWVLTCGGTTAGNNTGNSFDEYVWNDVGVAGHGATGGGVSARFPLPDYQKNAGVPKSITTNQPGRGIPDIAGNASENSGYMQFIQGKLQPVGGTSAVAPLYAGLIARINSNLGHPAGFINPLLYGLAGSVCRDVTSPPGPANNGYGRVPGYPAGPGWDACTGFGSVNGTALQNSLSRKPQTREEMFGKGRHRVAPPITTVRLKPEPKPAKVFKSGTFRGVSVTDAFAKAASEQGPVTVNLGPIAWPANLAPTPAALGNYKAGQKITRPVSAKADVLIILYTEPETSALLDVFTGNKDWSPARRAQWCGYAHNFAEFKPIIQSIAGDDALEQGMFGYLSAVTIGARTVVLYKSELHPKQNGNKLPIVPVIQQLIGELAPTMVISTGTAGAIGSHVNCGDVTIVDAARFHCQTQYPNDPDINTMSVNKTELTNNVTLRTTYIEYAAANFTKLSLAGLSQCYSELQKLSGYGFVKKNVTGPAIYVAGSNPAPGPQPMVVVSADYLTVDDNNNSEGLQPLGIMNETDDAFVFYAISTMTGTKPQWLSVRNASEPQIVAAAFPPGTSQTKIVDALKATAGSIYGIYQYCTTLNSAFACWGIVAGM